MIEGLGSVRLEVIDLERSLAFYRDGLRFQLEQRDDGASPRAHLRAGGLHVVLTQTAGRPAARGRGILLALAVTGIDAYRDALIARGIVAPPPADSDGARGFVVCDPDGYRWQFNQSLG